MCSVLTIKLLMKKKIEKVINKEIKKKKRSAWYFLATKKKFYKLVFGSLSYSIRFVLCLEKDLQ